MSRQIFISYSSKDASLINKLAGIIADQEKDWDVWWDKKLPPGKKFDRAIGDALDRSSCIVVVWSPNSVKSDWVLDEALEARERDILIPIMLGKTDLPFGYRRLQTIDFTRWRGARGSGCIDDLVNGISSKMNGKGRGGKTRKKTKTKGRVKVVRRLSGGLDGKTIVFTGKLAETRKAHAEKVEAVGARFVNSGVSKNTDFLVVGDKPGAKKMAAARQHRVKRLTEKQWLRMLNDTYKRILIGKEVVFAGTLSESQQKQAKRMRRFKVSVKDQVTRDTHFLVMGKNPGKQKLQQGEKYGTQIIKEELWTEILASLPRKRFRLFG